MSSKSRIEERRERTVCGYVDDHGGLVRDPAQTRMGTMGHLAVGIACFGREGTGGSKRHGEGRLFGGGGRAL